jgi:undecaprenyl-diphosphatase
MTFRLFALSSRLSPEALRSNGSHFMLSTLSVALGACCLCVFLSARADEDKDGPFEFDHRLRYDSHGLWARKYQLAVEYGLVASALGVALYEGSESRMGGVAWKTLDSMLVTAAIVQAAKPVFSRARPSQSDDSGRFFQGRGNRSFPSGEVAHVAAAVTPALMEYGREQPWLYAAAGTLLVYDSVARMKTRGHWASDVIAGAGVGAATGYFMERRDKSFLVSAMPGGAFIGYSKRW